MTYRLGLDTGGTYTDAVIIDANQKVVACAKSLTTHGSLINGLRGAVEQILDAQFRPISLVSLSTTLATNALVEGRGRSVCLVLIGYTQSQMARARLQDALGGDPVVFIQGGHRADGSAANALDVKSLEEAVMLHQNSVEAFAVSSMFSVRNPEHELQAQSLIHRVCGKPVSCGHSLSSGLDAPRRALTTLFNARLVPMIGSLLKASKQLLKDFDIDAPLMVVKGDGSLVSGDVAEMSPVETILSGPAASVVGAQFLHKSEDALVSDMGGTTTDVAIIEAGQPRLDSNGATVGGWRTMVRAVDVKTFGLGGDSAITYDRELRDFVVGPERVMPLSLLIQNYPHLKKELEDQLELPFSTTHSAQFVMAHAAMPTDLTATQLELWEHIQKQPISVQSLFADQTLDRALVRLIQRGVVLRAGFTPSDASHLLGIHSGWDSSAATLGADLLMRYSRQNLGRTYTSVTEFAGVIQELVAQRSAFALLDTLLSSHSSYGGGYQKGLTESQRKLLTTTFHAPEDSPFKLDATLRLPIVALGAPVGSYYPRVGELLNTEMVNPEFSGVANAVGAVVGSVRQEASLTITAVGGKRVRVHYLEGPVEYDDLELAAVDAIERIRAIAEAAAIEAGATDITLSHTRKDNVVEDQGERVFFDSQLSAIAIGRPATT